MTDFDPDWQKNCGIHLDFGVEHAKSWYAVWGEGLMRSEEAPLEGETHTDLDGDRP